MGKEVLALAAELAASAALSSSCVHFRLPRPNLSRTSHNEPLRLTWLSRTVGQPILLPSFTIDKMASGHDESACSHFELFKSDGLVTCLSCGSVQDTLINQEAVAALSAQDIEA